MDEIIHEDKTFDNIDYSERGFSNREFVSCEFNFCNFQKSGLSNNDFMDCSFKNCNFSLAELHHTGLKNCKFMHCKLMGIDFSTCNDFMFAVSFTHCVLDYSSFYQKKMKKTVFKDCSLKQTDFTETDLTQALFADCNLEQAVFLRSILEKADFRSAQLYSFDPEQNRIRKARFSTSGIAGLLAKYNIDIE